MLFCIGEQASKFKCYSVLVSRLVCLNVILCDGEQVSKFKCYSV